MRGRARIFFDTRTLMTSTKKSVQPNLDIENNVRTYYIQSKRHGTKKVKAFLLIKKHAKTTAKLTCTRE